MNVGPRPPAHRRLPRVVIGDRIGVFEVVALEGRDVNWNAKWVLTCTDCGMRCVRSQSTVNRWRRGDNTPPTTCKLAHIENGNPSRAGGEYMGVKGPQSATEKRRREMTAEMRDTRRQRICCQCCGLPHHRPRKGPCKCGGRYAEERATANDVVLRSNAGMCL